MHTSSDDVMAKWKKTPESARAQGIYQFGESRADLLDPGGERNKSLDTFNLCLKRWVGGRAARKMFS
jgi:hypothetical protein